MSELYNGAKPTTLVATGIDWGSVPDWVAGLGTVGGLVFIGLGLLREMKLRRLDDERAEEALKLERAASMDEQARQARSITLVAEALSDQRLNVHIRNDSPEPILNVDIGILTFNTATNNYDGKVVTTISNRHAVVRIGGQTEVTAHLQSKERLSRPENLTTVAIFTDVNGRRWRRIGNAEPTRLLLPRPGGEQAAPLSLDGSDQ